MDNIKRYVIGLMGALLMWAYSACTAAAQCSMCAATVEANGKEQGGGFAAGLNTGILYLMVVPYILFSVVGFIWYRSAKKRKLDARGATR